MPVRTRVSFFVDPELATALKRIKIRDGIPEAEQIRRGIRLWIDSKEGHEKRKKRKVAE